LQKSQQMGKSHHEYHPVMEGDLGNGEVGIEVAIKEHSNFWTIYAGVEEGRALALADLKTESQANDLMNIFRAIYNSPRLSGTTL